MRTNLSVTVTLMIQAAKKILVVVSALFPIVDPIGGSPFFLVLSGDYTAQMRRLLARRIALNSMTEVQSGVRSPALMLLTKGSILPANLPPTVGPGSVSVAITLGANEPRQLGTNLLMILAAAIGCAFVAISIYLCYGFADRLAFVIGATGMNVILKLSSFLLVCIGVQIVWNGLSKLLNSLLHLAGLMVPL